MVLPLDEFAGVVYSLVYLAFGVLLWLFSGKLSAIMVTKEEHTDHAETRRTKSI